jgi:hypothetical protein
VRNRVRLLDVHGQQIVSLQCKKVASNGIACEVTPAKAGIRSILAVEFLVPRGFIPALIVVTAALSAPRLTAVRLQADRSASTPGSQLPASSSNEHTRTVFVSVLDKERVPVRDLRATDFEVKESGKTARITNVSPAAVPLRIAIIDADAGTGAFQQGLLRFMQKLIDRSEFSLISVVVQPIPLIGYSSDGPSLSKALEELGRRGREQGAQLMEAVNETARAISADSKAEGKRPVILVLRLPGGEATSSLDPSDVRAELQKSGAILDVLSIQGARPEMMPNTGSGAGVPKSVNDQETTTNRPHLFAVLNDGSRESGGRNDEIPAMAVGNNVEAVADDLLNQYAITYVTANGIKPGDKLSVSTDRKGANVYAPNHTPRSY